MEFSRQEYWSGLSVPSPEDLPNPGIEPRSPALQADSLPAEPPGKPKWHVNVLLNSRAGKRADFYWFLVQYSENREMYSIIENDKYD